MKNSAFGWRSLGLGVKGAFHRVLSPTERDSGLLLMMLGIAEFVYQGLGRTSTGDETKVKANLQAKIEPCESNCGYTDFRPATGLQWIRMWLLDTRVNGTDEKMGASKWFSLRH